MSIDIDTLTLGQIKEIQTIAGVCKKTKAASLEEKRVILVVDRGWIFAGDQSSTSDGYICLKNAVHIFRWESMGFAKMVQDGKSNPKVDLRPVADVEIPRASVIFRVEVPAGWGLK